MLLFEVFSPPCSFVYLYFQWFGKFTLEFGRKLFSKLSNIVCTRIWLLKLDSVFFVVLKWKRNRSESGWHGSRSVQQNLAVGPARPRQGRLGSSGSSTRWASADQHSSSEIIILQSAAITATSRCADCRPLEADLCWATWYLTLLSTLTPWDLHVLIRSA